MTQKKRLLKRSRLYAIFDRALSDDKGILDAARKALAGGADMIQLRAKSVLPSEALRLAARLGRLAKRHGAPFIVNDRLELAVGVSADGCHIGQGDADAGLARRLLGKKKILGISVSDERQAEAAAACGADYLGVGPVFSTPIKKKVRPKGMKLLKDINGMDVPFFAIGGINEKNARLLRKAGVRRIAVIRAITDSSEPRRAARRLKEALA